MMKRIFALIFLWSILTFYAKGQDLPVVKFKYLKSNDSLFVFKLTNYSKTNSYPLIYLLNSHSSNYRSRSKLADLQREVIIGDKAYCNIYAFLTSYCDKIKNLNQKNLVQFITFIKL